MSEPTLFSRIIAGELPGRFVWRDDVCVAFLSIAPLRPGHVLVVPIVEVDHWLDLDAATAAHLTVVAQEIGRAQMDAFRPSRIGLTVVGFEVPHVHLHVVPIDGIFDMEFGKADHDAAGADLDRAAAAIRAALVARGAASVAE